MISREIDIEQACKKITESGKVKHPHVRFHENYSRRQIIGACDKLDDLKKLPHTSTTVTYGNHGKKFKDLLS